VRPLRIEEPGAVYHVTTRGNNGRSIYDDVVDRYVWLGELATVRARMGWIVHAYCEMGNHFHLLVETPLANLADGMCQLNGAYARGYNVRHRRSDHLFGRRYWCERVVKDRHLVAAARYIVRNPVRAGLCAAAWEWEWSSYRETAGLVPASSFLAVDWVLGYFSSDRLEARQRYARFVAEELL
jgi:REP element-mobilizing transposase RayT